ncbi:ferredoxin family protein [Paraburkholderia sartisoli]|uniref:Ferredoxin n=1 Tax=Paraburkholderia sartisoli TaxID=83784 RepID=A0A1H4GTY6_9BURK|nr:ferredoxin family protein [Paraburkholderia sartisoli]SEB13013.1 ferredoxin [Paraburkholderia sartisoli]
MTHVVTQACERCKYTDCVEVCPTDSFHEGPEMLVINPDDCIDCGVCIIECPVDAILEADDLPPVEREAAVAFNHAQSRIWPLITRKKAPLADPASRVVPRDASRTDG